MFPCQLFLKFLNKIEHSSFLLAPCIKLLFRTNSSWARDSLSRDGYNGNGMGGLRALKLSLPEKLDRPPIVEAAFELRFEPRKESAADLLVGLLYTSLKSYQQRVQALPAANVPRPIRDTDPRLRYLASHQLSGDGEHVLIGDRALSLSKTKYRGWRELKESIKALLQAARGTELIGLLERYSLKAVNILPVEPGQALGSLNAKFEIANRPAAEQGFQFRTEFVSGELTTIIEIAANANVTIEGQVKSGMLIGVDTVRSKGAEGLWDDMERRLEELHSELKNLFFELLTPATIKALGPM